MTEIKKGKRIAVASVVIAAITLATVVVYRTLALTGGVGACSSIPTCDGCTMTVTGSGTSSYGNTSGFINPYNCTYFKAGMKVSSIPVVGLPTITQEVPAPIPASGAPYVVGLSLPFTPRTPATLNLYYHYGFLWLWTGIHPVSFVVP